MTDTERSPVFRHVDLPAGLHLVATPIGTARDITLRALDTLASADVIAAEDTRTARHLMEIHGVPLNGRPVLAYHDHNGAAQRPRLVQLIGDGKSVAYVSEAGTPLVADPGYQLARAVAEAGLHVTGVPGPSAMLAALTLSALPSDRFLFAGFAPAAAGARKTWLQGLAQTDATTIIYESPKRVSRLLGEMVQCFGPERPAALCRELTKRYEEVLRGTLSEIEAQVAQRALKGELVLVVDRPEDVRASDADLEAALLEALCGMSLKEAAAEVSARFGVGRREVYQMGLRIKKSEGGAE